MRISIVCVGKIKEKYLKLGIDEFSKRLSKYCKLEVIELDDEKAPENLSDKEIRDEIYDILKQEISNATNVDKEDITFETYQPDSGTERTKVTAGEKNYVNNRDLRSPINFGNTLSNKVAEIINHSNNNSDRKELIKQLKKAREFSEEKDLKVDGDNLKDVKQPEENER